MCASVPDSAIYLQTHSTHCGDDTLALSTNKGEGVSVYVKERWCVDIQVVEIVEQTSKC